MTLCSVLFPRVVIRTLLTYIRHLQLHVHFYVMLRRHIARCFWQLDSAIRLGQFTRVRNLVDGITDVDVIRDIEAKVG